MKALILGFLLVLVGCTGTRQLYNQAETPVQYVKVVLLHHNALGTQVADITQSPEVSEATRMKLVTAYRKTVCSSDELSRLTPTRECASGPAQKLTQAGRAYEAAANAQTDAELQAALNTLVMLLTELITAVDGAT